MRALVAGLWVCLCPLAVQAQQSLISGKAAWTAGASDGVKSQVSGEETVRLEYGFAGAGYAFAVHPLAFAAPENFVIEIPVRGEGAGNELQLKFTDASGENVWWVRRPDFMPTPDGEVLRVRPRHIEFAWGTVEDKRFRRAERFEVVVVRAAKGAVSGWLEVGPVTWRKEAPDPVTEAPLKSSLAAVIDEDAATGADITEAVIDLSRVRPFGGVKLDWARVPQTYSVDVSDDGKTWRRLREVRGSDGGTDYVTLGEIDARFLRVEGEGRLNEVALLPLEMGLERNALLKALAEASPRGTWPRGFSEQAYWTVVGVAHGGPRALLLSEDGAVEIGPERPSIEPVLSVGGVAYDWAKAIIGKGMDAERLPLPFVEWQAADVRMKVSPVAFGEPQSPYGLVRYELSSDKAQTVRLDLRLRPVQVNPPEQFLTRPGGFAPIRNIRREDNIINIDGQPLWLLTPPARFMASGFLTGPQGNEAQDDDGLASGVLGYDLHLEPGKPQSILLAFPLGEAQTLPDLADPQAIEAAVRADWQQRLGATRLSLPAGAPPIGDTLRLSVSHMLMLMDGDWLKPGARSYDRSWIRDGAMMSEGLLRVGSTDEALAFFKAYAPMSFDSGKVPCCVDARGADPTPEHDSHGQLAYLASELIRYGVAPGEIAPYWPQIAGAIAYQEGLRQENLTPETPARFRGLMPPSISHEGYSDKAAYSHWDNFWALKGYRGAAHVAQSMGRTADAERLAAQGQRFHTDLRAALQAAAAHYGVDFAVGASDRGDFDPTSTTMGVTAGAHEDDIPEDLKRATFERYWNERLLPRRSVPQVYVPYELRNVAAFVRLKQPGRARQALNIFFADQAPREWLQWGEVVTVPYRQPLFIGDLPHGWVSSDYVRSALDLFAWERPEKAQMVLLGGFDPRWAEGEGTRLENLHTPYGRLSFTARREGKDILIAFEAEAVPPGGFAIDLTAFGVDSAHVDGRRIGVDTSGEFIIHKPRAHIRIGVDQ